MEENENQEPISNSNEFNFTGNGKKKKGMGPVKGLLLALLIVFLICMIGLLIRMEIAGDGDYFKPIKEIFGIEGEEEKQKAPKQDDLSSLNKQDTKSSERYTLLSEDVNDKNVKHYRMTLDISDIFDYVLDELENAANSYSPTTSLDFNDDYESDDYGYDDDEYNYDDNYGYDDDEYNYDDSYGYDDDEYNDDDSYGYDTGSSSNSSFDQFSMYMSIFEQLKGMIEGELYVDVYFEGNDLVQVIAGCDYMDFVENLYDYMSSDEDTLSQMEDEGVESLEDFTNYIVENLNEYFDEDYIYDELMEDEDVQSSFSELGIREKDIKDAIDIVNDKGLIEFYLNGTTKIKGIISMAIDSDDFRESLEETDYTFDEDNLIEDILLLSNETEEFEEMGIEFIEVN